MSENSPVSLQDGTWVGWFLHLPINEFLCRVPYSFIQDRFNLTDLDDLVPHFHESLSAILDTEIESEYDSNPFETDPKSMAMLYGLIHARYILSVRGIEDMCVKYQRGDFGLCPRIFCNGQLMLPVGLSDRFGESNVKVYCPSCRDIYEPHRRCTLLDGAMFGRSFPHMFFMQLPHLLPEPPVEKYIPRIYGFQVHKSALVPPLVEDKKDSSSLAPSESLDVLSSVRSPLRHFSLTHN